MKKTILLLALFLWGGRGWAGEEGPGPPPLPTFADKFSYTLGMDVGQALKKIDSKVDYALVVRGLMDTIEGKTLLLNPEEAAEIKQQLSSELRRKKLEEQKELGEKNRQEEVAFLAANREKPGIVVTASGLQYEVLQVGEGKRAQADDTVIVHYRGTILDGKEIGNSRERGEPAVFSLPEVIPGWREGVALMNVGSKYRFFVPAALAYGERSPDPAVGPHALLLFEMELLAARSEPPPGEGAK